jgi:Outer membrane protein and related peptidoglycan-associated (lipo)proteins
MTMTRLRWVPAVLLGLFPLGARAQGQAELGLFGQYTHFDANAGLPCTHPEDAGGGGGRLGFFLSREIEIEADAARASARRQIVGGTQPYTTAAARINYNIWRNRNSLILGLGAVHNSLARPDWGVTGLAGVRFGLQQPMAVRVDEVVDYMPSIKNFNASTRVGLTWLTGRRAKIPAPVVREIRPPAPVPVPPVPVAPAPAPPPVAAAVAPRPLVVDTVQITGPIYFDFDRSNIRPDAEETLTRKLPWLSANPEIRIRIEGGADERGSDEYNIALGQRRAASARHWLTTHGISPDQIGLVSFGEERPVCAEHDEPCWQLNRRDDFRILRYPAAGIVIPPGR